MPNTSKFGPTLEILVERLYDTVNRGPLLKCFLTKSSSSRVDIARFDTDKPTLDPERAAIVLQYGERLFESASSLKSWSNGMVRDWGEWVKPYLADVWAELRRRLAGRIAGEPYSAVDDEKELPLSSQIIDKLIEKETTSISFQLDIAAIDTRIRDHNLALYRALGQKISRTADLIRKEAGIRSLWLGYPLFLAHDLTDPENPNVVLAPLLLWAIDIEISLSRQGQVKLSRDPKTGAPFLNRVLQQWIKTNLHVELKEVKLDRNGTDGLTREQLHAAVTEITAGLQHVTVQPLVEGLTKLPSRKEAESLSSPAIINSAVIGLFVSENQALINNLESLKSVQAMSEPLESLLSGTPEQHQPVSIPPEHDRYLVTDSDPFQEVAVWDSRFAPGTVVHGPPGTGKSQTIVNIVADALAHGQRVLVVCQKRAAIDVVAQRIHSSGLSDLSMVVHDSEGDRRMVMMELKEQIGSLGLRASAGVSQRRGALAQEIERRESELDAYNKAVQQPRSEIGLSYRTIASRLGSFALAKGATSPDKDIGQLVKDVPDGSVRSAIANLTLLSGLCDRAEWQSNPWRERRTDFFLTATEQQQITNAILSCITAATCHDEFVTQNGIGFLIGKLRGFGEELNGAERTLEKLSQLRNLSNVGNYLKAPENSKYLFKELFALQAELEKLDTHNPTPYVIPLNERTSDEIELLLGASIMTLNGLQGSWWQRLRPAFRDAKTRFENLTRRMLGSITPDLVLAVRDACRTELKTREIETKLALLLQVKHDDVSLKSKLAETLVELSIVDDVSELSPELRSALVSAIPKGADALAAVRSRMNVARDRAQLLVKMEEVILRLQSWIRQQYLDSLSKRTCAGETIIGDLQSFVNYLPRYRDFIAFEAAKNSLDRFERGLLDCLLSKNCDSKLWEPVILHSALTEWGEKCRQSSPELTLMSASMYQAKKESLARALQEKRQLESRSILDLWNQRQLSLKEQRPSPFSFLKAQLVTRGPNSKRLREAIAVGAEYGIFTLRPCWLTNPNTACQLFGLTPGLFDIVIFDEASQCPVEQAVPIIQRAKRIVVSGDEKQLPPTSFFLSFSGLSVEQHQEVQDDLTDEELAERALETQILNSKDLLAASQPLLRNSFLNMHYRSQHPALIEFSNNAFYGGRLQYPPAKAGAGQASPIFYREISGIYENNQNQEEAAAVIKVLREVWAAESRPTVGVITFNSKQQELIENLIQEEAIRDPLFRADFETETAREDGQQQVGFFVKNLETVQGDERDVIIFSTTFGKDSTGVFKRFFGPLNLEGGERRLNVAITRAKQSVYVLTSMPVFEISDVFSSIDDSGGRKITGREFLQGYLLYAKAISEMNPGRASEVLKRARQLSFSRDGNEASSSPQFDSEFEVAVYEALAKHDVALDTQVGAAGFYIDLAVKHPDSTRGYLLGIECDGKAFHSSFTARARDIWRERILRSRGWRIHRIWSSDWWANPHAEVQKVLDIVASLAPGKPQ
jgi:primosomal replication protein N''